MNTVDKYRNKMRETLVAGGQDVETVAPHFETRRGKRIWVEKRNGKGNGKGDKGGAAVMGGGVVEVGGVMGSGG